MMKSIKYVFYSCVFIVAFSLDLMVCSAIFATTPPSAPANESSATPASSLLLGSLGSKINALQTQASTIAKIVPPAATQAAQASGTAPTPATNAVVPPPPTETPQTSETTPAASPVAAPTATPTAPEAPQASEPAPAAPHTVSPTVTPMVIPPTPEAPQASEPAPAATHTATQGSQTATASTQATTTISPTAAPKEPTISTNPNAVVAPAAPSTLDSPHSSSGLTLDTTTEDHLKKFQSLINTLSNEASSFNSIMEKLNHKTYEAQKNTELAESISIQKSTAIKKAEENLMTAISSLDSIHTIVTKTVDKVSEISTQAVSILKAIQNDPKATDEQKNKAKKFYEDIENTKKIMPIAMKKFNECAIAIQEALEKTEKAVVPSKPLIEAHEAVKKAHQETETAQKEAEKATFDIKSSYDLNNINEAEEARLDCLHRTKEESIKRENHCIWLNDIAGSTIRCNAINNEKTCNAVDGGHSCVWGEHENRPFCFHN